MNYMINFNIQSSINISFPQYDNQIKHMIDLGILYILICNYISDESL